MSDLSFLEEHAGKGLDKINANNLIIPMALIAQKNSGVVNEEQIPEGHWYNSETKEDYGQTLKVILCDYHVKWYKWEPDGKGLNGIFNVGELDTRGDPYKGYTTADGCTVEEKEIYLCALADGNNKGPIYVNSTRGSAQAFKKLNTMLMADKLESGKTAPIFSNIWEFRSVKMVNRAKQYFYGLGGRNAVGEDKSFGFKNLGRITGELFTERAKPIYELGLKMEDKPNEYALVPSRDGNDFSA